MRSSYPLPTVTLFAFMDQSLRQDLVLSDGSFWILVQRPISLALLLLSVVSLLSPYLIAAFRKFQSEPQF